MAKKKKIDLENIPKLLEKAVALVDRELDALADKHALTSEEGKTLIAYVGTLSALYKEYRQEVIQIKKELKEMPKEDLQALIKAEAN